jgi:RNA polymerase sigma-70 factor (ECF subfamily)
MPPQPVDPEADLRLVRGAREGRAADLDELLRRLRCVPAILRVRNRFAGGPLDDALMQDVAQEVLVALWSRLDRFTGASSLEAWVYRFCVHKHLAAMRNRGRRMGVETLANPLLEGALAPAAEGEIDDELVQQALENLEGPLAQVVELKHFEDLTFDALSGRLDISPNTAKTRYYRALGKMRDFLAQHGRPIE